MNVLRGTTTTIATRYGILLSAVRYGLATSARGMEEGWWLSSWPLFRVLLSIHGPGGPPPTSLTETSDALKRDGEKKNRTRYGMQCQVWDLAGSKDHTPCRFGPLTVSLLAALGWASDSFFAFFSLRFRAFAGCRVRGRLRSMCSSLRAFWDVKHQSRVDSLVQCLDDAGCRDTCSPACQPACQPACPWRALLTGQTK